MAILVQFLHITRGVLIEPFNNTFEVDPDNTNTLVIKVVFEREIAFGDSPSEILVTIAGVNLYIALKRFNSNRDRNPIYELHSKRNTLFR